MKLKPVFILFLSAVVSACGLLGQGNNDVSRTTGWAYNDGENGNISNLSGYEQETGPGLVFIQGGTFTMGRVEQDVMFSNDNAPRRVTVASFYMDETEVSNLDYREFTHWTTRMYPGDRAKISSITPDSSVWRSKLAYNEPYVNNYFRHPAFSDYPVVGVTWEQANAYCSWRTDRVNEQRLIDRKILSYNSAQSGQDVFTTATYMNGMYEGTAGDKPVENSDGSTRRVQWEDGILLPNYRLPTEAEWEYAAYGLAGNVEDGVLVDRKIYPWNGNYLRDDGKTNRGQMRANFVRGRGDMMGMAGALNDNAEITAPVYSYSPNDYGLFCMAGNVNEWVADVYRPMSSFDTEEFNPYRGNVITSPRNDDNGNPIRDKYGVLEKDTISGMDYRNVRDGDKNSQIIEGSNWNAAPGKGTDGMYQKPTSVGSISSLISDKSRVYKGGSWRDRPYWLSPGARRYLDQDQSRNDIGFRCAMTKVGGSRGL